MSTAPQRKECLPALGGEQPQRKSVPWWGALLIVLVAVGLTLAIAAFVFGGDAGEGDENNPTTTEQADG